MSELNIALVQSDQHWHDPIANRTHFGGLIERAAGADLVVLPEMFSTGFTMASKQFAEPMSGPTVTWLIDTAQKHNTHVCGSMIVAQDGNYYNRFFLIGPDRIDTYDKRHLFRMANEHEHFSAGDKRQVFELRGVRILPQVCYDLRFPVYTRNQNDYDLALFVANWPAARRQHWRTLLTARAIENQAYVLGLNRLGTDGNDISYAGDSGLIDANGDWCLDMLDREGIEFANIDTKNLRDYRSQFPAWKDADSFSLAER